MIAGVILCLAAVLAFPGCGDTTDTSTSTGTASAPATATTPQDHAAQLAAQSQLRNAQMAQEAFFAEKERYASTTAELKGMDAHLNPKIELISGTASTFEMKITANDTSHTVYIIRRTASRIERVDGEGNPW